LVIKFTCPWQHEYIKQIAPSFIEDGINFSFDDNLDYADLWIVWGGLLKKTSTKIPFGNLIYITDECHDQRIYSSKFLKQFDRIYSVKDDLPNVNVFNIHEFTTWHFDYNYETIRDINICEKKKKLSIVCSDLTTLPGHKKRFAFVNKLIGHFNNRIDVFGRGFNPIENKWDALAPYEYSIAIENNKKENYFSEKLIECFLSYTIPVYYGCPNIEKYFPKNSFINIDIDDFDSAVIIIDNILNSSSSPDLESLKIARNLYLEKFHLFQAIKNIIIKDLKIEDVSTQKKLINKKLIPEFKNVSEDSAILFNYSVTLLLTHIFKRLFQRIKPH
jgi:hypothetical protein